MWGTSNNRAEDYSAFKTLILVASEEPLRDYDISTCSFANFLVFFHNPLLTALYHYHNYCQIQKIYECNDRYIYKMIFYLSTREVC